MFYQKNPHNYTRPRIFMKIQNVTPSQPQGPASLPGKKLLDQMRDALRTQHYSYRTENTYVEWAKRFILFHNKRHPRDMGVVEVQAFITHLATQRKVAASTHTVLAVGAREIRRSAPFSFSIVKFSASPSIMSPLCDPKSPSAFLPS
jgi:Phage integrase, N-terminal SAM-like domain